MSEPTTRMTFKMPLDVEARLSDLARATDQSETRLAMEAISSYLELQGRQTR
ncbi:MAG TPA: hypothetical protein VLB76_19515 [Thermoanaerobaculia bacterium]|jgi:predicted transcriptional regulator|nr:hypothetical protein [Thermoanaerobaculia bacterium]